jgi:hypothetical protein
MVGDIILRGGMYNSKLKREYLNNVRHGEVLYGSGRA